ncbi:chemotaxis protein CheY [Kouleothrix aurantiaca]|jgi:CheY-like chemotaxis protein|uniref:Chemotaxis protein CheY n=1 Tax=Kouleothrix aurantiaca TaxID=186479 RepID=A0A0P9HE47_9CHLR|nr:chemotaxis protein CheY [Kouleothrix aurantiaca]
MNHTNDHRKPIVILLADDDEDDRILTRDAFAESYVANELRCVADGEELMEYLQHRGAYADPGSAPRPGLILLDLNMPRLDGREAIQQIRNDPDLRRIPIVVLTTSKAERDIVLTYDLGVNSFIIKPVTFSGFVDVVQALGRYWFEIVELPDDVKDT